MRPKRERMSQQGGQQRQRLIQHGALHMQNGLADPEESAENENMQAFEGWHSAELKRLPLRARSYDLEQKKAPKGEALSVSYLKGTQVMCLEQSNRGQDRGHCLGPENDPDTQGVGNEFSMTQHGLRQQQEEAETEHAQSGREANTQDVQFINRRQLKDPETEGKVGLHALEQWPPDPAEGNSGAGSSYQLWWRSGTLYKDSQIPDWIAAAMGGAGRVWVLPVHIQDREVEALVDTGASRSFLVPSLVAELGMATTDLYPHVRFRVASGKDFVVRHAVEGVVFAVGSFQSRHEFLVAQVPHRMILGADWLWKENVIWDFKERMLCIKEQNTTHRLMCEEYHHRNRHSATNSSKEMELEGDRKAAAEADQQMASDVRRLGTDNAAALVRAAPKSYKGFKNRGKLVPIKRLLKTLQQKEQQGTLNELMEIHFARPVEDKAAAKENAYTAEKETQIDIGKELGYKEIKGVEVQLTELHSELDAVAPVSGSTHRLFEEWLLKEGAKCPDSIKRVLCARRQLFVDQLPAGLPPERVINHRITLLPGKMPSKGVLYRLSREQLEAQREILQKLKEAKWITMTSSPFAAPAMIVTKKEDGSGKQQYRMVINYQELNAITISPEYPLTRIQDILDMLHGAKVFTSMDMEQGFHQIRMAPEDQYKTAFRTFMGQYEFKVMPFGLRGAPGTFQAVMNHMFLPLIGKGVIAYLDDVLVYSEDEESHAKLLEQVLKILWEHRMFPKFKKCQFASSAIDYLGYRIGGDGITPSPAKLQAIEMWPEELRNDTQVKQFLGTANYCRMFMGPAYADMARPLVELTKKGVPFVWTDKHTAAVKALKHTLVNYTTVQTPDPKKPYVLRTDASGYAVGGVLEQDGKPLGFMSLKMSPGEQGYAVYDQELLALIRVLEKWRQLLLVASVTAYTDHRALQYLTNIKAKRPVRPRTARWLEFLMDFQDLKVEYKPGASNVVADALSRCPYFQQEAKNLTETAHGATEMKCCFLVQASGEDSLECSRYAKALTPLQDGENDPQWKSKVGGSLHC